MWARDGYEHEYAYLAWWNLNKALMLWRHGDTQRANQHADMAAYWQQQARGIVYPRGSDEERAWLRKVGT